MTHVKGYTTKDGKVVAPHEDRRPTGKHLLPAFLSFLAPAFDHPQHAKIAKKAWTGPTHPKADEDGEVVPLYSPHEATPAHTWDDHRAIATFTPGGEAPKELNGIPMAPWEDHPTDADEWNDVQGTTSPVEEPPLPDTPKAQAAGVVIEEPDGRVWVVHPSNKFGGYKSTFPKGHTEDGIDLQPSAIKEAYEESGLKVELTGFLCDVDRTTTTCRYYLGRRVGGTPTDCGWESQAVSLVPRSKLYEILNMPTDHGTAEALGAGPRPELPKPEPIKPLSMESADDPTPWW